MATRKAIAARLKLELSAGEASVVDLGKMLGPTGVNMRQVKRAYDEATAERRGEIVPVVVSVYEDRTFDLLLKTPPTSFLVRRALNGEDTLTTSQLRAIAERKLPDLNTRDVDAAMRTVAGTARSMGVAVEGA